MNKEVEEFDIPVKNHFARIRLGVCIECGKRYGKYLCNYIVGYTADLYGKGVMKASTCDRHLCEKCTNKFGKMDFCKEHIQAIKNELKGGYKRK